MILKLKWYHELLKIVFRHAWKKCCVCLHVVTIYGIDAVANEIDVALKFFDSGMKIQDFN
jgi:hypothetical protein